MHTTLTTCALRLVAQARAVRWLAIALVGMSFTPTGFAQSDPRGDGPYSSAYSNPYRDPFDFTLSFSRSDIDLRDSTTHYPVNLERISLSVFSLQEKNIHFGFNTGSSYLSMDNDTVLTGMSLNGYHAGFALRGHYGRNPQLGLHADYRYQETRHKTDSQSATLSWHEWTLAARGRLVLGQRLGIVLGWAYSEIEAGRSARGDINDALNLRLDSAPQLQVELEWLTGAGGRVSLAVQNGAYENLAFNFAQTFR
ncbi:MAG: hypothetical protein RRB22_00810 [Gammaproteobacteria bacterium]|nr:hypothetical protein [Gammaproteobacteria bacterium]